MYDVCIPERADIHTCTHTGKYMDAHGVPNAHIHIYIHTYTHRFTGTDMHIHVCISYSLSLSIQMCINTCVHDDMNHIQALFLCLSRPHHWPLVGSDSGKFKKLWLCGGGGQFVAKKRAEIGVVASFLKMGN